MLTTATIIAGMGIVAIAIAAFVARLADGTVPPPRREQPPRPDRLEPASDHPSSPLP